jgi:hypothetical protein
MQEKHCGTCKWLKKIPQKYGYKTICELTGKTRWSGQMRGCFLWKEAEKNNKKVCPECGTELAHEGGCSMCYGCGWSACS